MSKVRWRIFSRDRHTCVYCGHHAPNVKLHLEHMVPLSRGGTWDESNLVTACQACNLSKMTDTGTRARLFPCQDCGCWYLEADLAMLEDCDAGWCPRCSIEMSHREGTEPVLLAHPLALDGFDSYETWNFFKEMAA